MSLWLDPREPRQTTVTLLSKMATVGTRVCTRGRLVSSRVARWVRGREMSLNEAWVAYYHSSTPLTTPASCVSKQAAYRGHGFSSLKTLHLKSLSASKSKKNKKNMCFHFASVSLWANQSIHLRNWQVSETGSRSCWWFVILRQHSSW